MIEPTPLRARRRFADARRDRRQAAARRTLQRAPRTGRRWAFAATILFLCACDTEGAGTKAVDAGHDVADTDAAPYDLPDNSDDARVPEPDTADLPTDSEDGDAPDAHDVETVPPLLEARTLALGDAVVTGGHLDDGCVTLDPGGTLAWAPGTIVTEPRSAGLDLHASSWRGEARLARFGQSDVRLHHLWGHNARVGAVQTAPSADAGYGVDHTPVRAVFTLNPEEGAVLSVVAETSVCQVHLVPPSSPIPDPLAGPAPTALPPTEVALTPCGDACDDGAAISEAVAAAEGPTTFRLSPGSYRLTTPILIRRSHIALVGSGPDTTLVFDPDAARDRGAALEITGPGPGAAHPVIGGALAQSRALVIDDAAAFTTDEGSTYAYVTADDYGEVPGLCEGGRDVERRYRHHHFLARVRSADDGTIQLSRTLPYPLPEEASPTVAPVQLLEGVVLADLTLVGACPEAADVPEHTQSAAACSNPHILGVSAVRMRWAYRPEVLRVQVRHFGRYAVETTLTLGARIVGGGMTLPADYGSGGAGYGVHTIRAGRTLVHGYTVVQARHAVVADFGSTEIQVVGSQFSACTLAAIDVHGEASYDTLALGNEVRRSNGSVVVGGGGRAVHCNDGPRHHFIGNLMESGGIINIQVTDYSSQVFFHHNTITDSVYSAAISAGSADILFERNAFQDARAGHLVATDAVHGTDRIVLLDNEFDGDPATWITAEDGITVTVETSD